MSLTINKRGPQADRIQILIIMAVIVIAMGAFVWYVYASANKLRDDSCRAAMASRTMTPAKCIGKV